MVRADDVALTEAAHSALHRLEEAAGLGDPVARSVLRRVRDIRGVLAADALHGEVVKKARLPAPLVRKHGIGNLFVEDLPGFWRLLYTVIREGQVVHVVVVEIADHRTYDRWFPGRGR